MKLKDQFNLLSLYCAYCSRCELSAFCSGTISPNKLFFKLSWPRYFIMATKKSLIQRLYLTIHVRSGNSNSHLEIKHLILMLFLSSNILVLRSQVFISVSGYIYSFDTRFKLIFFYKNILYE